jgi:hypothetical protein
LIAGAGMGRKIGAREFQDQSHAILLDCRAGDCVGHGAAHDAIRSD